MHSVHAISIRHCKAISTYLMGPGALHSSGKRIPFIRLLITESKVQWKNWKKPLEITLGKMRWNLSLWMLEVTIYLCSFSCPVYSYVNGSHILVSPYFFDMCVFCISASFSVPYPSFNLTLSSFILFLVFIFGTLSYLLSVHIFVCCLCHPVFHSLYFVFFSIFLLFISYFSIFQFFIFFLLLLPLS